MQDSEVALNPDVQKTARQLHRVTNGLRRYSVGIQVGKTGLGKNGFEALQAAKKGLGSCSMCDEIQWDSSEQGNQIISFKL